MTDIIWSPDAKSDLRNILSYCHRTFGINTARKVNMQINRDVQRLLSNPLQGYIADIVHSKIEHRILLSHRLTKIIYSVHTDYIYIHMLWNTRQEPERLSYELSRRDR